jgi:hypothetical protein
MRKAIFERMVRETTYFYPSQIERTVALCLRTGCNKSEVMRAALESFLRFHGLRDPGFKFLASDIEEELIAEYREDFMQPFVEMLGEKEEKMGDKGEKDESKRGD